MENEVPENIIEIGAEATEPKGARFTNDLDDELKARIKDEAAKRIDEILEQPDFSVNDLTRLAGVSHGSVKARAKSLAGAAEIITAILNGERATGIGRKPSKDSVKSLLDSMTPEEKQKFLADLGLTEA